MKRVPVTGAEDVIGTRPLCCMDREHPGSLVERICWGETCLAYVIRAGMRVEKTTFFSPPASSFQFGLLAHKAGFVESPHYHKPVTRTIGDLQQMFVVQRGVVVVQLYSDDGDLLREVFMYPGDAIVLIRGTHALRVVENMQCISVKQGPFLGTKQDKVPVEIKP